MSPSANFPFTEQDCSWMLTLHIQSLCTHVNYHMWLIRISSSLLNLFILAFFQYCLMFRNFFLPLSSLRTAHQLLIHWRVVRMKRIISSSLFLSVLLTVQCKITSKKCPVSAFSLFPVTLFTCTVRWFTKVTNIWKFYTWVWAASFV